MERLSFGPRRQRRGLDNPTHFPDFVVSDGLVFLRDDDMWRLVVPSGTSTTRANGREKLGPRDGTT
jgi:hypothetical protein